MDKANPPEGVVGSIGSTEAVASEKLQSDVDELRRWLADNATVIDMQAIAERSMSIMTAYLAGELPPAVADRVTDLLRSEPRMRHAYAGLLAVWQMPNADRPVSEADVDAAWERFKILREARFGKKGLEPGSKGRDGPRKTDE